MKVRRKIAQLRQQLVDKEKKINNLNESIDYLQDLLNDNGQKEINVFDENSKTYSSSFKQCVYEILQNQVSASKVSSVISAVLKMAGLHANKLPCRSTVLNMNLQRLYLAQVQLGEVFAGEENTVLLTDETSKFGSKYMVYEASDSQGNLWVLGLRDIETKSASDTLKVFKQILQDLDDKSVSGDNETSRSIIFHIVATLSDRAATEVKFNSLLYDFRKEILPLTYYNYHTFTDEEKKPLESLCNFFCGLHALVNFAETAKKCVKEVESGLFNGDIPCMDKSYKDADLGTCRLIRTASKAFGEGSGGDEKSGCQGPFKVFVKEFLNQHKMRTVPLRSFRGARFNVLFDNAATVFFLHEKMKEFLKSYGNENRLLKSVSFDVNTTEFIAGVKALGLISKLVTCPLWNILESTHVSIMDMNEKYLQLVTFFDDASRNVSSFMRGELLPFGDDTPVEKDSIYDVLITMHDFDGTVELYLQVLLPALCQLGRKLFKEHLPGGNLHNLSPDIKEKVKAAPKTSCFAESVFGQLDHLLRTKPNITTLAAEACIMFLNNKTLNWLECKTEEEKIQLIKKASRGEAKLKKQYKDRLEEINENRRMALRAKIQKHEALQQQKREKQEQFTKDILSHGLWQSETEIDNMLSSYESNSEKIVAVKAQLKFRKDVLHQKAEEKSTFNMTKAEEGKKSRKSLSLQELITNLKILVRQAIVKDNENQNEKHILVGRRVKHRFLENGQEKWYRGKIISQVHAYLIL